MYSTRRQNNSQYDKKWNWAELEHRNNKVWLEPQEQYQPSQYSYQQNTSYLPHINPQYDYHNIPIVDQRPYGYQPAHNYLKVWLEPQEQYQPSQYSYQQNTSYLPHINPQYDYHNIPIVDQRPYGYQPAHNYLNDISADSRREYERKARQIGVSNKTGWWFDKQANEQVKQHIQYESLSPMYNNYPQPQLKWFWEQDERARMQAQYNMQKQRRDKQTLYEKRLMSFIRNQRDSQASLNMDYYKTQRRLVTDDFGSWKVKTSNHTRKTPKRRPDPLYNLCGSLCNLCGNHNNIHA